MGDGDHHVLLGDQILVREIQLRAQDLRLALVAVALADVLQLLADHLFLALFGSQDGEQFLDFLEDAVVLVEKLVLLQRRQSVQGEVQNAPRLFLGKVVEAVVPAPELGAQVLRLAGVHAGALEQPLDGGGRPALAHEAGAGVRRRSRGADEFHHLVDALQRHRLPFEQMAAPPRPPQQVVGAPHHHFAAMAEKGVQHFAQIHGARLSVHQGDAVDAEHHLQLRQREQVVQHHLAVLAAAQLDDHAQAVFVGLVADLGDALDALLLHQFGDALDHLRFVHLVGNLRDDDGLFAAANAFHLRPRPNVDAPAPRAVGAHDAGASIDNGAGGKVRALDVGHQCLHGEPGIVDQR